MDNHFTLESSDDTIFTTYKTWEEIPVSTPNFKPPKYQICYISLPESEAIKIMNKNKAPINKIAYEYLENIQKKPNEVIIKIELDISNMLDLTNRNDYNNYMLNKLQGTKISANKPSVIRTVLIDSITHFTSVIYMLQDYTCIKNLCKIQ